MGRFRIVRSQRWRIKRLDSANAFRRSGVRRLLATATALVVALVGTVSFSSARFSFAGAARAHVQYVTPGGDGPSALEPLETTLTDPLSAAVLVDAALHQDAARTSAVTTAD